MDSDDCKYTMKEKYFVYIREGEKQPVVSLIELADFQLLNCPLPIKYAKIEAVRRLVNVKLPPEWKSDVIVDWISKNLQGRLKQYEDTLETIQGELRIKEVENKFVEKIEVEFNRKVEADDKIVLHFIIAELKGKPLTVYKNTLNPINRIWHL